MRAFRKLLPLFGFILASITTLLLVVHLADADNLRQRRSRKVREQIITILSPKPAPVVSGISSPADISGLLFYLNPNVQAMYENSPGTDPAEDGDRVLEFTTEGSQSDTFTVSAGLQGPYLRTDCNSISGAIGASPDIADNISCLDTHANGGASVQMEAANTATLDFEFNGGANSATVTALFLHATNTENGRFFDKRAGTLSGWFAFSQFNSATELYFGANGATSGQVTGTFINSGLPGSGSGEWMYVVTTYSGGAAANVKYYVGGVLTAHNVYDDDLASSTSNASPMLLFNKNSTSSRNLILWSTVYGKVLTDTERDDLREWCNGEFSDLCG